VATVLLLRHARSVSNAEGTLAGQRPVELDEAGVAQAKAVGAWLGALPLATVVSSPLLRCRRTLELALPDAVPEVDARLAECGYGQWEGRKLTELAKDPLWTVVQAYPSAVTFPGGESMAAMSVRSVAAVRDWDARVEAEHGAQALWLACSHGDVIKSVIADALGLHLDLFQRIAAEPAGVTAIRYTPLRSFLLRLNDTGPGLAALVPTESSPRTTRRKRGSRAAISDAPVGGGDIAAPVVSES
jgi:probable phosphomutase (TIGR03848 family)